MINNNLRRKARLLARSYARLVDQQLTTIAVEIITLFRLPLSGQEDAAAIAAAGGTPIEEDVEGLRRLRRISITVVLMYILYV